jgi:hypothetical protein
VPFQASQPIKQRWMHPGFVSRDRQASTQLSSLHSQQTQDDIESEEEEDELEEYETYVDRTDPENPRRKRKISKIRKSPKPQQRGYLTLANSSPGGKKIRPSTLPFSSDQGDIPFDMGGEELFPDLFPDPFVATSSPMGLGEVPIDIPIPDMDLLYVRKRDIVGLMVAMVKDRQPLEPLPKR